MDTINYEPTEKSPLIEGSISTGKILIQGRSYPENAPKFFQPLRDWLEEFYKKTPGNIEFEIDFDYVNTATTVILYDIIHNLSKLANEKEVHVTWKYESDDVDMINKGNDFKDLLGEFITLKQKDE
ncbi:MAG: DUF1987 domain-containing protein [Crocinitomicaceae bacterium]|nr:DUF1987 domain-containing protein [Crocinitomicaceae bacterium]